MPRSAPRGGPQTRATIIEAAARLFYERGFDQVTVAQVAKEAGVSTVTVFNHFPTKEDLFLDRAGDAEEFLRGAIRDRADDADVTDALHALAVRLIDERHPLSGLDPRSARFFRTVADSRQLVARARGILFSLQSLVAEELRNDASRPSGHPFAGDPDLYAALFAAGYASLVTRAAARMLAGHEPDAAAGRAGVEALFDGLRNGLRA